MIGSLGLPELLFILVLALLIFGPRKLPEIGRTLGRALGEFRRATSDLKRTLDVELTAEDLNPTAPVRSSSDGEAKQGGQSIQRSDTVDREGAVTEAPEPKAESTSK